MSVDPDADLMLVFKGCQEEAFVQLYNRYRDRIVNFSRRFLNDQARSEEAAQDVFLKLFGAKKSYEPKSRFTTFIYRIATNHCLNIRGRAEHKLADRATDVETRPDAAVSDATETVARSELRRALAQALATLPKKQSAALLLCHYEGFSYREAAQVIEVSESALKSLIHRAREALMKELEPLMEPGEIDHAV